MHLAFLCVLQQLVVAPQPAEVGQEVVLRVEREGEGEGRREGVAAQNQLIMVRLPAGEAESVGMTGAEGEVRYVPQAEGSHVFSTVLDGVRLVAPVQVVAARPRWLYALVCIPLGLALLIGIMRAWAADRSAAGASDQGA